MQFMYWLEIDDNPTYTETYEEAVREVIKRAVMFQKDIKKGQTAWYVCEVVEEMTIELENTERIIQAAHVKISGIVTSNTVVKYQENVLKFPMHQIWSD